jgi:hypothetical protein
MAARGLGLSRALGSSSSPAWKRASSEAGARLKNEYDAVVIGAGNPGARAQGRKAALLRGLEGRFTEPHCSLYSAQLGQEFGWEQGLVRKVFWFGHQEPCFWCYFCHLDCYVGKFLPSLNLSLPL